MRRDSPVSGALELRITTPRRTHNSGTIAFQTCPNRIQHPLLSSAGIGGRAAGDLLHNRRYILRKLAHTCSTKFKHDPAAG